MINSSSTINMNAGADSFTDLASLHSISNLGKTDTNQALEKVAEQFESMMVRMMMKSMRSANEVFAEGNYLTSHEGDMYQEMFDDQMALSLSQGRGMGIADVMVRQLQQRFGKEELKTPESNSFADYLKNRNTVPTHHLNESSLPQLNDDRVKTAGADRATTDRSTTSLNFDGTPETFVAQLYPMAKSAADKLGVEPETLLAQAALETGWGARITSLGDRNSHNLFNIKADKRWQGSSITVPTLEVRQGTAVKEFAAFRAYQTPQQSFDDYVDFISNSPRYEPAVQAKNSEEYIQALGDAGYATDPDYSEKILSIMKSENMQSAVAECTAELSIAKPATAETTTAMLQH